MTLSCIDCCLFYLKVIKTLKDYLGIQIFPKTIKVLRFIEKQ